MFFSPWLASLAPAADGAAAGALHGWNMNPHPAADSFSSVEERDYALNTPLTSARGILFKISMYFGRGINAVLRASTDKKK